jgi:hypothetical protein
MSNWLVRLYAAHVARDLPLRATGDEAILGPTTTPNPGNVG